MAVSRQSRADVIWEGGLAQGSGRVALESGVADDLPVTWEARTEGSADKTTPEELIAGAHAACFAMALSGGLGRAGHEPRRLEVGATCTFDKRPEGWRITTMSLEVQGDVPGMEAAEFAKHAAEAKDGCPVSNALKGNVAIDMKASFV
jgi:osmotically inducible protein OsmC